MTLHPVDIPVIETERLTLRAPVAADVPAYRAFLTSPRSRFVGGPFKPQDAEIKLAAVIGYWSLLGFGRWIVAERGSDRAIGLVGLIRPDFYDEPELGWTLFDAEGKGYAYEAATAARRYAYETLHLPPLMSLCDADNTRSVALAQRMGCTQDGTFDYPGLGPVDIWRHPAQVAA